MKIGEVGSRQLRCRNKLTNKNEITNYMGALGSNLQLGDP